MAVQVKSNMQNYLKNIRKGVMFSDAGTILDELVQNAQRAAAGSVDIMIGSGKMIVDDDGEGCEDPQILFCTNDSAWTSCDEAFGQGFFSVFAIADSINIRSRDWAAHVDVVEMLQTGDLSIQVAKHEPTQGFHVELVGGAIFDKEDELLTRAKTFGELSEMDVSINGESCDKRDLLDDVQDDVCPMLFSNSLYEAQLYPTYYGQAHIWYESREVCKCSVDDISGNIILKKNAVTLKAPDRKDIVHDRKWSNFITQVESDRHKLYAQFVKHASDSALDDLTININYVLRRDEYAAYLPMAENVYGEAEADTDKPEDAQYADLAGIGNAHGSVSSTANTQFIQNMSDYIQQRATVKSDSTAPRAENGLKQLIKAAHGKVFWVDSSDASRRGQELAQMRYEGFLILLAPNSLYRQAYDFYGVRSLDDLYKSLHERCTCLNVNNGGMAEQRFLELIKRFERRLDIPEGTIGVADISIDMVTSDEDLMSHKSGTIRAFYDARNKKIWINRPAGTFYKFKASPVGEDQLSDEDWRMMLSLSYLVCHELTHMIYKTADGTSHHEGAINNLIHEMGSVY